MKEYENSILRMKTETGLNRLDIEKILTIFFEMYQEIMDNLDLAVRNCNYQNIKTVAHKLKGSSGNLRLLEIYNLAKKLEEASENKDIELCKEIYIKLDYYKK